MRMVFLVLSVMLSLTALCQESGLRKFFSPIPKPNEFGLQNLGSNSVKAWQWRPIVSLPTLKLTESVRPNTQLDALLLTSVGGGISLQKIKLEDTEAGSKAVSTFSWSPLTVLLSGNLTADNPIDLSVATTVGFFNNLIMIGGGYDLGTVNNRSRWFGVLSIGVNFNN